MKVFLVFFALLLLPAVVLAKETKAVTISRFACLNMNSETVGKGERLKYYPDFIRFNLMGKDLANLIDFVATYNLHETPLPKDASLNLTGNCDEAHRSISSFVRTPSAYPGK